MSIPNSSERELMYLRHRLVRRFVFQAASVAIAVCLVVGVGNVALGQTVTTTTSRAVGGVSIDTDGILHNAQRDELGALSKVRSQSLEKIPNDLGSATPMRKISLRRLEATLDDCVKNNKPIPDAVKYLAGLQHIRYVFVYPEQKDIVLVGPGEGWKVDGKGNVVGVTTGRPVMLLDDLLVALRTARAAADGGITCSIDPTRDGLARLSKVSAVAAQSEEQAQAFGDAQASALGMQQITVQGVPETSHFARMLVAADYRMKRIAMNFDASPVHGLPSYLQMVKTGSRTMVTPRFWLEPRFDAMLRDADGVAFEFRGAGVKAMTEEDFVASTGTIRHSGKAGPMAQKWADIMTEKYPELAVADPIFGQLQDCMELAVVGALIVKERLAEKAGYSMPTLLESSTVKPEVFNSPKQVDSKASVLKKGRNWVISASGGVAIHSWAIADKLKTDDAIRSVHAKAAAQDDNWYWN
jgi:hypothetical protein